MVKKNEASKKGGGGGKKAKKGKKEVETKEEEAKLREVDKETMDISVRDLEEKLERWVDTCRGLRGANQRLENLYAAEVRDKKDVATFLKRALEEKCQEVRELQDQVLELHARDEHARQLAVEDLATVKKDLISQIDVLKVVNRKQESKLTTLEEFRLERERTLQRLEQLEQALTAKDRKYKEDLRKMEKKAIQDYDRLFLET